MIKFSIPVEPISVQHSARARVIRGKFCGMYSDDKKKMFVDSIMAECQHYVPAEPLKGPLDVSLKFYLNKPEKCKSDSADTITTDVDNISKGVIDAIVKTKLFSNDKQICRLTAEKMFREEDLWARIDVEIKPYLP